MQHIEASNKYMKNHDKNKESSYLIHLDTNNSYGWAISQKLPVEEIEWKKKRLDLMKNL